MILGGLSTDLFATILFTIPLLHHLGKRLDVTKFIVNMLFYAGIFSWEVAHFALRGKELFTSNAIMIQKQGKQEIADLQSEIPVKK